jgi:glycosyltransferase involved in cell wall biosynthesis
MDQIKIVFILGTLDIGGAEKQFIEAVRHLKRDRFDVKVLSFACDGKLRSEIEALQIPLTSLGFSGLKGKFHPQAVVQLYRLMREMVRYLRREQPQIVQSYLFWANIYGSIAAKLAGIPVIITGRKGIEAKYYTKWHYRGLQTLSNLLATTIITNSINVQQYCVKHEKYVTPAKVRVFYDGIELSRFAIKGEQTDKKKTFPIPADAPVVGIIANLHPIKGHKDFLTAAAAVLQMYPQTVFLVVGRDIGIKSELEAFAQELHIRDAVIFTGERDDIPDILSILDLQVSSSLSESFSNVILEGMAAGKPIVATAVGGTPELVVHEETGFLVPAGNSQRLAEAMIRLLGDQALRVQMGDAGRRRIELLFRIEQTVQQLEAFYHNLVQ